LLAFIESDTLVDKTTWFNFDRLTFRIGSAEIAMDESSEQLTNISEIMKAYPATMLKIGGYTDNTGSEEVNTRISQQRADAVCAVLVGMGVDESRLDPEGYGPKHPVASNDTEEGRAMNRRIAVRVKEK
jgi:K(+)-stimulated pyrophosphate-energized sodium pump